MGIEKHLRITGTSTVSWKDAVVQTVAEASRTIDYLTSVKILEQKAKIDGKKLVEYFVELELSFVIDRDRD
ncbi:MAG: dodecin domain-containing protein [Clostridia bacterium]|nr:dodecin domain-containing protein [Clostridia bacterium]